MIKTQKIKFCLFLFKDSVYFFHLVKILGGNFQECLGKKCVWIRCLWFYCIITAFDMISALLLQNVL